MAYNFNLFNYGIFNVHIFDFSGTFTTSYIYINYHKKIAPRI